MSIKTLFDPTKDIYRTIEKVITFGATRENRLKAEISEYIVTESIEEQLERLLSKMQSAMEMGGQYEIGVWLSGFYGSGKSSFAKYLGMALDERAQVDGVRFLTYLQNRMQKAQTRALLNTVATRYPAAVFFLDLASEMIAGASRADVSTVLYYKVLQAAGYSRFVNVAALERRMRKDGRYAEFTQRVRSIVGRPWREVQDDPMTVQGVVPRLASEFYPALFPSPADFNTDAADFVIFENERVAEMIEIAREASGKEHIIFVVDEVGQYVGTSTDSHLILNLDGLAKNLKEIGDGKVWLIGTAQQTLTEDSPRAALNSPLLYKLEARFPIKIDLESDDIKVICYQRLLGKSVAGVQRLEALFDQYGQALRYNTKLQDARYYTSDFGKAEFVRLYPFLPAHFDILLNLLGALARSTGGLGLRSAIKVVQDILIDRADGREPLAEQPVGVLATTVTLYDVLEKEIRNNAASVHRGVNLVLSGYRDAPIHQAVAKTVAILQIVGNMPVTAQNIAALIHPAVAAESTRAAVDAAIQDLIADPVAPFGEKEGNLCFYSEKINDIDRERAQLVVPLSENRRIQNEGLRALFNPLPATRLHGSVTVTAGLRMIPSLNSTPVTLAGERETIQMVLLLSDPASYDSARSTLAEQSCHRSEQYFIYLLGRTLPEFYDKASDIYRAREIARRYRNDADQEVRDYCNAQIDRAAATATELERLFARAFSQGSFIFRGQTTAADTLALEIGEAAKKELEGVAEQVFDRYGEAPVRADTALAEKFLRLGNLNAVTAALDPMGLVRIKAGTPTIDTQGKALISIRDYLERNGVVDGKRLMDYFGDAPFGWSSDTLRYLLAAMLVAGELRLRISGHDITVVGQQAIEALRTNNAFKAVGVSLKIDGLSMEVLARAAERLGELTGEMVIPLEAEIGKVAVRTFPDFQHRFGPLAEKLAALELPGADTVRTLNRELADILVTDGSDAPERLGSEVSSLYDNLQWAAAVDAALKNGLETTVRELQRHRRDIDALPASGVPGDLRASLADDLAQISQRLGQPTFYAYAADLSSSLTEIRNRTRDACVRLRNDLDANITALRSDLQSLYDWAELEPAERAQELAALDALAVDVPPDLAGLKRLVNQLFTLQTHAIARKNEIARLAAERRTERNKTIGNGKATLSVSLVVPPSITSAERLDELIRELQELRKRVQLYENLDLTVTLKP